MVLLENPEGKRLLERHRRRWKVNITMDRKGIGWEIVEWISVTHGGVK
jgi:hypothetical protein